MTRRNERRAWRRLTAAGCALALAVVAFLAMPGIGAGVADHEVLEGLDELRARFDADAGKVRAVFLAAPT